MHELQEASHGSDELHDLNRAADAIRLEDGTGGDHISDLSGVTYREMVENRSLLDRAGRAISAGCDCDYLGALEKLDRWATLAREGEESPTLREVFDRVGTQLIRGDLRAAEEQRQLDEAPMKLRRFHQGP
jgi:hypothetical protein